MEGVSNGRRVVVSLVLLLALVSTASASLVPFYHPDSPRQQPTSTEAMVTTFNITHTSSEAKTTNVNISLTSSEAKTTNTTLPPTFSSVHNSTASFQNLARLSSQGRELLCNQTLQEVIVNKAKVIMSIIDDFKNDYVRNKFKTDWDFIDSFFDPSTDKDYVKVCDASECAEVLPTLPTPPHHPPITQEEAKEQLANITGWVQQYIIAMEQVFLDQSLTEDIFQENIDDVYRLLEGLTRVLTQGVEDCQAVADDTIVRQLASKIYTSTNTFLINQRGFRSLRQCRQGLQYIVDVFSSSSDKEDL
ncbi:uncharacterized protein LOC121870555 [Homarus americanus]|uniref:Uncharacterized protein n=1 Tax=Homarus americanus TaxID=6706 RepID=A0A8J5MVX3_HOMAM|nr:uncharacterized protein LOC121870555 [Homarus americanus]KAG7165367.1 hypothetical protein Hamer_G007185 [Homarus americanus]